MIVYVCVKCDPFVNVWSKQLWQKVKGQAPSLLPRVVAMDLSPFKVEKAKEAIEFWPQTSSASSSNSASGNHHEVKDGRLFRCAIL